MGACSPFWFGHFSQHQVSRTKTGDVLSRNLWLLCCSCFAAEMCVGQGLCWASLPYWPARVSSGRKARAVPQCACSAQRTRRMHWGRQPFHLQMRTTARPHNQRELLSYRAWSEAGQSATPLHFVRFSDVATKHSQSFHLIFHCSLLSLKKFFPILEQWGTGYQYTDADKRKTAEFKTGFPIYI